MTHFPAYVIILDTYKLYWPVISLVNIYIYIYISYEYYLSVYGEYGAYWHQAVNIGGAIQWIKGNYVLPLKVYVHHKSCFYHLISIQQK